ncbi:hypothetical protein D3C74_29740 [compost metagenome]
MSLFQIRLRWAQIKKSERVVDTKVAYLSTFTINPLEPYLGVLLEDEGLATEGLISPYNQVVQECLMEDSVTARFQPNLAVIWPRLEDLWSGKPFPLTDEVEAYTAEALEMAEQGIDAARRWGATLVFVLPSIPERKGLGVGDANNVNGVYAVAANVREALRRRLARNHGVLLVDAEEVVREFGASRAYNDRLYFMARIPYTEDVFHAVAGRIAKAVQLSCKPARKVIAVDADNTLWGGVVGEDGIDGVDLADNGPGEAYKDFQSYLLELRRTGVLLVVCSKNAEEDVWAVFGRREMRLKREHVTASRIGWQPKSESLRQIAEELGLGLSSFIFIDDNPLEIAEVQAALPEVACIQMPADPTSALRVLQQSGHLDRFPPTTEDLGRAAFYEQESQRRTASSQVTSVVEYRAGLGIRANVFEPSSLDIARLTQLINKTNQFNLNLRRRTETEVMELVQDPAYLIRLCQCSDRFGDYGIVGALIVKREERGGVLDTFVLSCRVLGRGIEQTMIASMQKELAALAPASDAGLYATLEEHPRNEPARVFFSSIGAAEISVESRLELVEHPSYIELTETAAV